VTGQLLLLMITNSIGPTQQAREGNHAELTAEAQAKKRTVKLPSVNFSSRRCVDIELGILLP
jgi:hypothetical protein